MSINTDVGDKFRELIRQQKENASLLEAENQRKEAQLKERIEHNRRQREERERIQRQKEDQEVKALREKERQRVLKAQEMIRQKGLQELEKIRVQQQQTDKGRRQIEKERQRLLNAYDKVRHKVEKDRVKQQKDNERRQERETQKRERAEFAKWAREMDKERKRRLDLNEQHGWRGSKKVGLVRRRLNHKLDLIQRQPQPVLISNAIRGQTQKWSFPGGAHKDPVIFLEQTSASAVRLIDSINSAGKKVNGVLTLELVKSDPVTGKDTYTVIHCRSKVHIIYDNANDDYADMRGRMLENFYKWQRNGSGWRLHSIDRLDIYITKFDPVRGRRYKPFPQCVVNKKAVINMENNDDQCFRWAVTRALHPVERDAGQISKILRKQSENYNWSGLEFPVKVKNIHLFETNNHINVNVFSYDDDTKKIYTLRLSKTNFDPVVNLFLYDEYYGVVKNSSRLVSSQKSKRGHKKHICERCLNHFGTDKVLQDHLKWCAKHDHLRHVYPNSSNNVEYFKQYQRTQKVPFAVYADFECFLPLVDNKIGQGTTQYQHHTPSGFCYTITCMDDNI